MFVVSKDGATWHTLAALGIEAADTPAAIEQAEAIAAALDRSTAPIAELDAPWLSPVVRPEKMFGIGLNYMDHIRETGASPPQVPVVFAKFPNSLNDPEGDIIVTPSVSDSVDYEVELAVVIGRNVRDATAAEALDAVFGYCVANDVSARDIQKAEAQFNRSKSFDTFCPIGPWITSADEVLDPQELRIRSEVNGEARQVSTTAEMIFSVRELIVFLSQRLTLKPGDVILTGTPHGVGFAMDPPRFLTAGDRVRCEIEGLGALDNRVAND
jgi:2-keto-4-pentenoate hydratase/2-oxohepta-3-ene-1,7-dioic acid hydratase in catechol pathway